MCSFHTLYLLPDSKAQMAPFLSLSLVGLHCELQHQNGTQTHWENNRATRTITVAICYCFLLQWAAIILWHIITSNYFKLNKRCDTIRLTIRRGRNGKGIIIKMKQIYSQMTRNSKHTHTKYIMKEYFVELNGTERTVFTLGIWISSTFHLPNSKVQY